MTAPHAAAEPRNRLPLLVGVGAGLIVLLLLATKVLGGGGGGSTDAAPQPAPRVRTTATTAAPAVPAEAAPVETFEVFNTKNPFMPLRGAATAPAASATPAPATVTATPAPVVATPVAVTTPPAAVAAVPVAAAPVQNGATGGQTTAPVRTTRVALLDVFAEGDRVVANVRVNDTVSKVAAGDTFASNFKVVSLDSATRCGRFLFGDDQFQLCRGEEVLK